MPDNDVPLEWQAEADVIQEDAATTAEILNGYFEAETTDGTDE